MMLSRRGVLRCLTGIIAAPAIVRADALMRVVAPRALPVANVFAWDMASPGSHDISIWRVSWGDTTHYSIFPEAMEDHELLASLTAAHERAQGGVAC